MRVLVVVVPGVDGDPLDQLLGQIGRKLRDRVAHNLVDENRRELNMAYAFEGVDIAKPEGYSLSHFKEVFSRWDSASAPSSTVSAPGG